VKEEGGILCDLLESNNREAFVGSDLLEVERFKFEVEVLWLEG
jgi:hypothetical protein